ncbi:hypothetical protein [Virgibacillus salexigens]|uniref:CopG family transcriptional regulator n=1 Tax=Virgibacillus kapii TaxID=1638645 RepID=A0ABQ2E1J5_9BACI|nr:MULTISPECIES: hypothetical protein [Virgibacillus]MYL43906.1 hypothetical protein [Virgibacillus massiliensis]GGJ77617.1 hypothetical protein GCM10007111_43980 [Virgibacillus kapii]
MAKEKREKERIELRLDTEKDADLIEFIDENGTTRAGFVKFVLYHYMNSIQGSNPPTTPKKESKPNSSSSNKTKKTKKKVPKLGQSFSSNDFEE